MVLQVWAISTFLKKHLRGISLFSKITDWKTLALPIIYSLFCVFQGFCLYSQLNFFKKNYFPEHLVLSAF